MRILSLLTFCMAGAMSLSATGKAGQSTASVVPTKSVQAKNVEAQNAPPQHVLGEDFAVQNVPAQTAPKQEAPPQSAPGRQNDPSEGTPRLRALPQALFDKGIYGARNALTGSDGCFAIQSYNFSKAAPGKMPQLESITTCTSVTQPLMRKVRKPKARYLELQIQPEQDQQDPN
ncbi:MAG TPA: hypothetical protein VNV88_02050 [Candidatus Solibacter sp.]|nr:hypothetical protein [Candidatus Solibacter sp.]